jgi:hypothetical protein
MGRRRKRKKVNYEKLYNILQTEPLDYAKIRAVTGVSNASIGAVIDCLSLRYPLYQISKGVYGLLKDEEDGKTDSEINREKTGEES